MKLNKKQNSIRKEMNKIAYFVLKLCLTCVLIIILLKHFVLYEANESMWWVLLSIIIIYGFRILPQIKVPLTEELRR